MSISVSVIAFDMRAYISILAKPYKDNPYTIKAKNIRTINKAVIL